MLHGQLNEMQVWLAVHGWYHPASETDSYRQRIAESLGRAGVKASVLRGVALPYGRLPQAVLPILARDLLSYRVVGGITHDLYGDSVFRGVDVATIHDLYWNLPHHGFVVKAIQIQQLIYQDYGRTVRKAKHVVVTTQSTRSRLLQLYGAKWRENISVVSVPIAIEGAVRGDHSQYDVVWIGSSVARKRPLMFARLVGELPSRLNVLMRLSPASSLVSDDIHTIRATVNALRFGGRQFRLVEERISEQEMNQIYRSSKCLVSTSVSEGFHVPVAEAYLQQVRVVLPRTEPYLSTYGEAEGVHWYHHDHELKDRIIEAAQAGPFRVDPEVVRTMSFSNVGNMLRQIYEQVQRR